MTTLTVLHPVHLRTAPNKSGGIITDGAGDNALFPAGISYPVKRLIENGLSDQWAELDAMMYYNGTPVPVFVAVHIGTSVFCKLTESGSIETVSYNRAIDDAIDALKKMRR